MKNSQQGLAPIVWIIIAALVLGGWYVVYKATDNQPLTTTNKVAEKVVVPSDWKTYLTEKYGFEFQYPAMWSVINLQASSSDYIPLWVNGTYSLPRSFVGIYPTQNRQDFSARVDVYNVSLATALRDNRFISNQDTASEKINGVVWTKIGVTDYLIESNGQTYHIAGQSDVINQILSTFRFTK